jgi:predicted nucleic acid-binding Zn ribbon protein
MTLHRRSPRALAGTLTSLRDGWAPATVLAEVQRVWPSAVGAVIAAEAQPVSERAGVLTVACENAAWAHELDLMGPSVLARLGEHLGPGRITRLRCVSGGRAGRRF